MEGLPFDNLDATEFEEFLGTRLVARTRALQIALVEGLHRPLRSVEANMCSHLTEEVTMAKKAASPAKVAKLRRDGTTWQGVRDAGQGAG